MAKTKKELLAEAESLGIKVDAKAKVGNIEELIKSQSEPEDLDTPDQPVDETATDGAKPVKQIAKAGKRSAKALAETAEKQDKEKRKTSGDTAEVKSQPHVQPARPKLERRGKHFRKSAELIDKNTQYKLTDAIDLAKKTSHVKFDATVELHINLGVDPKLADQNVRDNVVLPAGTGKNLRVAALTDDAAVAKKAGADIAGTDELLADIEKGKINFDILIATPQLMSRLGSHARVLGPKGLMPNPKSGTVTNDVAKAISEAKAGRVEYRVDSSGIVHLGIGKVSFTDTQLAQNLQAIFTSLKNNKPQSLKGDYIKSIHLTTSMGPSITVDPASIDQS